MSFIHSERVRFGDLDAMRHLNNVVYLRYFESARIAFLRSLFPGHDPAHPESGDFGVIFAECHIAYRSPVHFDEVVDVGCSVGEVRRSAFQVRFEMKVAERLAAEGYGWLVGFDYAKQASTPLPERLKAALEAAWADSGIPSGRPPTIQAMFGVQLICSDERCDHVLETAVWTLDQADDLLCEGCDCLLQLVSVWESQEARARPRAAHLDLAA